MITQDLGIATAYGYAKSKGYTGTEAEFAELMASYASTAQTAIEAADRAVEANTAAQSAKTSAQSSASTASTAAHTATSKASEAVTAAGTATTKASEAGTSAGTASTAAQTATNKASEATTAATTATTKASEASESATTATAAKTDAETARDAAAQSASEAAASAESIDPDEFNRKIYAAFATDTATGSIASFPDGADNIPMKDVLVHIEPVQEGSGDPSPENVRPITGWTGAKVTRTGKNLASLTFGNRVPSISNGQMVDSNGWSSDYIKVDNAVNYTVSINIPYDRFVMFYDTDKNYLGYVGGWASSGYSLNSFSHWSDTEYIKLRVDTSASNVFNFQLELGSTATDYEPYSGQTYDITFPTSAGTVYGGMLDVTSGVLTVDRAFLNTQSEYWTLQSVNSYGIANFSYFKSRPSEYDFSDNGICNMLPYQTTTIGNTQTEGYMVAAAGNTLYVRLNADKASTFEQFKEWSTANNLQILLKLATPITYHLTPQEITSLLGENNVWADTGDSDVEYRADAKLYITKKITEAVSALS